MQHWGHTMTGKVRWFCKMCGKSRVVKRLDTRAYWQRKLFASWLTDTQSLSLLAKRRALSSKTLERSFSPFWAEQLLPVLPQELSSTYLVVDAVYLAGHHECVLIGRSGTGQVVWLFAEQETLAAWRTFFGKLPKPAAVACDGQSGLLSALKILWPDVPVERCLAHVGRLAVQKLTRHPHTACGQALLGLVYRLHCVNTVEGRDKWIVAFRDWNNRSESFLKERTCGIDPAGKRSWWYTHRRIRALKRTLEETLPNLFAFIDSPGVPSTTNLVEGGINSRLKELLHRHRGFNLDHKKTLVAYFLNSRNMPQKPT